jgi:CelD/BcsL family acetyltransferase involved in cellulose biosynthesis
MPSTPEINRSSPAEGGQIQTVGVRKLGSWEECEQLCQEWNQILQQAPALTIFSTPEWLSAWWKAFGQTRRLVAFSFSDTRGNVIGLAPLYLETASNGRSFGIKRLCLVGDGSNDSDNLDLIFRSGAEQSCSDCLLEQLNQEEEWDVCELNTLNPLSPIAEAMLSSLRRRRWPAVVSVRSSSAVPLPENWESYLSQLSDEQSKGIARYTRRLGRHHAFRIFKCEARDELVPYLEAFFDLHQKRWQSQGQPGSFDGQQRRYFYHQMSRAFLQRGWLELWLLELDGKMAAAQFAFRYGDTVYQLQEGLDPQYYSDRAGMVLRAHILKDLIARGVRRYDFLGGLDPHKQSWGAKSSNYIDISFAKPFSRGSFYLFMREQARTGKRWLRNWVPSSVIRAIKRHLPNV